MGQYRAATGAQTYFPGDGEAKIVDFVKALADRGSLAPTSRAALVAPDGTRIELPAQIHAALVQVAEGLNRGLAVTVTPMAARLTTQQAADFLGVSRPTLVRLLDRGEIPMSRPGRHRYVQLRDLVVYQEKTSQERTEILAEMAREAEESRLYDATDGPPPRIR